MVKEEHCDRNSLVSVHTDDGAAHGAFGAPRGPNYEAKISKDGR